MNVPGLPQIPTDNLYKFKTVAGLVVAAIGFVLYMRALLDQSDRAFASEALFHRYTVTARDARENVEAINNALGRGDSMAAKRFLPRADSVLALERAQGDSLTSRSESEKRRDDSLQLLYAGIAVIGFGYAGRSLDQWQKKHQDFQDRLLVAEVKRAELELKRLKAAGSEPPPPDSPEALDGSAIMS
jgi:hypothetical protein